MPKLHFMTKKDTDPAYFNRSSKNPLKKIILKIKHRLGWLGVPSIMPFRGFGSHQSGQAYITGMLSEDKGLEKPEEENSPWQNLLATLKRYSGDQIPDARVEVNFEGSTEMLLTEKTGLFKASFKFQSIMDEQASKWLNYEVVLRDDLTGENENFSASGEILIPGQDAAFGVISDIDDTILVSHSTMILRKLRLLLTRNSRTRKPFPGVEEFYRALQKGINGKSNNPFFYISSSEWNLYDLIEDFAAYNNFPKGVFLLREFNSGLFNLWKQGGRNHEHKFEKINHVFKTYPNMSFVLVGDNGQHDPEIYSRIAHLFPGRVKAIYIRTIRKQKDERMLKIMADLEKIDVQIVFTPDTINAAQHAQSNQLIAGEEVEKIIAGSSED